jgi:hypothetical protein
MVLPDRDDKGRFKKGYKGGPGRPKREVEEYYLAIMLDEITPDDWRAITKKAVEQAKRGDQQARKWLSDYLLGLPVQRTEHSGEDGSPIQIIEIVRNVSNDTVLDG